MNRRKSEGAGAPTLYGERMKPTAIQIPSFMLAWLDSQVHAGHWQSRSDVVRTLIEAAMKDADRERE